MRLNWDLSFSEFAKFRILHAKSKTINSGEAFRLLGYLYTNQWDEYVIDC
jgi:hypothetical protein